MTVIESCESSSESSEIKDATFTEDFQIKQTLALGCPMVIKALWEQLGLKKTLQDIEKSAGTQVSYERAILLTVLHRLMVSGSDRFCEKWKRDYLILGTEEFELHHLYRAMSFLGEVLPGHKQTDDLAPGRNKDLIEEMLFFHNRDLFSKNEHRFEWSDIKQDLKALKQVKVKKNGKCFAIRTESKGVCGKVFNRYESHFRPRSKNLVER